MIRKLENEFTGIGEAKGFEFKKIKSSEHAHIYEVTNVRLKYYEIFKRKLRPVCIDFEKRIFSDVDFKESYPKATSFGIWAWTTRKLERANEIYEGLNSVV